MTHQRKGSQQTTAETPDVLSSIVLHHRNTQPITDPVELQRSLDDIRRVQQTSRNKANRQTECPVIVLAHGAGADSQSEWIVNMAQLLTEQGIIVITFDFPYMIKRQQDGRRRPPDRANKLLISWAKVLRFLQLDCVIGGKSMGGRMATMLVASQIQEGEPPLLTEEELGRVKACVCLGYPFHPQGKPENPRIEHLQEMGLPILVVQGTRDPMGNSERVNEYPLSNQIDIHWCVDGDHDLKPRKSSGLTQRQHMEEASVMIDRLIANAFNR